MSRATPPALLPQEIAPVTPQQAALTEQHLLPVQGQLFDYLLALRNEMDPTWSTKYPPRFGKAYPLGRCQEITSEVLDLLRQRLPRGTHPAERGLVNFMKAGGRVRPIWGALRGLYLQNAVQMGSLYVDVSNDTVTVTKPKVEILPLAECGLLPLRSAAHFAEIAGRYWGAEFYANHLVPSLAPILPMVSVREGDRPRLQSACDYMIGLFMRDGFQDAEDWLAKAPPLPAHLAEQVMAQIPDDLRPAPGQNPRGAALRACRQARAAGLGQDMAWRNLRVRDYLRLEPTGA